MVPEWADDEYVSYESIVRSWGYEVESIDDAGVYQGDIVVLLRNGTQYGLVVIGYGSCPGCDHLEAIEGDWSAVEDLRQSLKETIKWFERGDTSVLDEMLTDNGKYWFYYDDEVRGILERYREVVRNG